MWLRIRECAISLKISQIEAEMVDQSVREMLANAMKRREELRRESEALDNLIEAYRKLSVLQAEPDLEQLNLWNRAGSKKAKSAYVSEMMSEIRKMLVSEGRPMTRSDLLRQLESNGYVVDGGDRSKVLGTNIWRSRQFMHIDGRGYWPKDIPVPPRAR